MLLLLLLLLRLRAPPGADAIGDDRMISTPPQRDRPSHSCMLWPNQKQKQTATCIIATPPPPMSLIRPPSRANSIEAPRGGGLSGFGAPPTTKVATAPGAMSRPLSAGGQARKSAAAAGAGDGVRAAMGWGAAPTTLSRPPSAGGGNRPGHVAPTPAPAPSPTPSTGIGRPMISANAFPGWVPAPGKKSDPFHDPLICARH